MNEAIPHDPGFRTTLLSALSSVLLADGQVDRKELAALRAAARALDLPSGPSALGAAMLGASIGAERSAGEALDPEQRALVYAAAEWMALADGEEDPHELAALDELRTALGLGPQGAAKLHDLATRLRTAANGVPSAMEFEALIIAARRLAKAAPATAP